MPKGIYKRTSGMKTGKHNNHKKNSGCFQKGNKPPWTGKKRENCSKEKHYNWQGGLATNKEYRKVLQQNREAKKKGNGGSHTLGEWETLKAQYNWTCLMCGKQEPEIKLTEDHIIPISRGGSNNIENIQPLCTSCNSRKHDKIISFRE